MFLAIGLIFSATGWAHKGDDPIADLEKNRSRLAIKQMAFFQLQNKDEQIDSLESQLDYLRKNIMILQNVMATDYPHVKEGMSKYKLDYIEVLDDSLKKFRLAVKQAGQLFEP